MPWIISVALSAFLAGCVTAAQEPVAWGRVDCRSGQDPQIRAQFEKSLLVCRARGNAAGHIGTATMPVGHGMGGAIASGFNRGMARMEITAAVIRDCMAQDGYIFSKRSEFVARCPATPMGTPTKG